MENHLVADATSHSSQAQTPRREIAKWLVLQIVLGAIGLFVGFVVFGAGVMYFAPAVVSHTALTSAATESIGNQTMFLAMLPSLVLILGVLVIALRQRKLLMVVGVLPGLAIWPILRLADYIHHFSYFRI